MVTPDYFQFVASLVKILSDNQIPYAIGGSFASSSYGEIRSTYDVDLTIQLAIDKTQAFIAGIQALGWYIFPESVEKTAKEGGDFQIIDGSTGLKADMYGTDPKLTPRQQRTLDRARIRTYTQQGDQAIFMSPEDVILYKLEWYLLGKSEKHLRDICAMLTVQADKLDHPYISQYAGEVNAGEVWEKLLAEYHRRQNKTE